MLSPRRYSDAEQLGLTMQPSPTKLSPRAPYAIASPYKNVALPALSDPSTSARDGKQAAGHPSPAHRAREDMRRRLQLRSLRAKLAVLLESWIAEQRLTVTQPTLMEALERMGICVAEQSIADLFRAFGTTDRLDIRGLYDAVWVGRRDARGAAVHRVLSGSKTSQAPGSLSEASSSLEPPRSTSTSVNPTLDQLKMLATPSSARYESGWDGAIHGMLRQDSSQKQLQPDDGPQRRRVDANAVLARHPSGWEVVCNGESKSVSHGMSPRRVLPPPPTQRRLRKLDSQTLSTYRLAAAEAVGGDAADARGRRLRKLREACVRINSRIIEALVVSCDMRADSLVSPSDLLFALQAVGLHATLADAQALHSAWASAEDQVLLFSALAHALRHNGQRRPEPRPPPRHQDDEDNTANVARKIQQELRRKAGAAHGRREADSLMRGMSGMRDHTMRLFKKWDVDRTGNINREELKKGVVELGLPARPADINSLFDIMDPDGDGVVELHELNRMLRWAYSNRKNATLLEGNEVSPFFSCPLLSMQHGSASPLWCSLQEPFAFNEDNGTPPAQQLIDYLQKMGGRVMGASRTCISRAASLAPPLHLPRISPCLAARSIPRDGR